MTTKFAFVVPTRNSITTLEQTLVSLAGQSHKQWRAVVIDDCSTDGTPEALEIVALELGIRDKIDIVRNDERLWEVANVLKGLARVHSDEVVCRLDLDDYLCDLNALEIVAQAYDQVPDLDALWTGHRWFDSNGITNRNISGPLPTGADPYKGDGQEESGKDDIQGIGCVSPQKMGIAADS